MGSVGFEFRRKIQKAKTASDFSRQTFSMIRRQAGFDFGMMSSRFWVVNAKRLMFSGPKARRMVAVGASPRKEWQQPVSPEGASENTTMSYTWLKYHIVFSTKERRPFLTPELLPRLCEYLGGMIKTQGGHPIEINGPEDHIHVVASVSPTLALADCLRDLKPNSTNWIHETFPGLKDFAWQDGYSAFTVSPSVLSKVVQYVKNQREHHKKVSFRDELIWLLKNHGIEFDEKYL